MPQMLDLEQLVQPEPKKIKFSKEELSKLARTLSEQIQSSEDSKQVISPRWKSVEHMYKCNDESSQMQTVEGMRPVVRPIYRPKADKIANNIRSSYFSISPWAQLIDISGVEPAADVELTLQSWLEDSSLKNTMRDVFLNSVHHNCGVIKVNTMETGQLDTTSIDPFDMMYYPCQVKDMSRCKTVGHRATIMRWEADEMVKSGEFIKSVNVNNLGIAKTDIQDQFHEAHTSSPGQEDDIIEYWELLTKIKVPGAEERVWVQVSVDPESLQILCVEPYPYEVPWYFTFKTSTKEKNMFPRDSIGGVFQHLQLNYNDIHTLIYQGSFAAAFPLAVISGGLLSQKVTSYKPGQMLETGDDIKLQYLEIKFNPSELMFESSKIEELADELAGSSQLQSSQNLAASTSAAAVNGVLNADNENKSFYVEAMESSMQSMFTHLLQCIALHQDVVGKRMGAKWLIDPQAIVDIKNFDVQATGGNANSSPQMMGQKIGALMQMAQDPMSNIDKGKLEQKAIEFMDVPFSTKSIMYGPQNPPPQPPPKEIPITLTFTGKLNEQPPDVAHNLLVMAGLPNEINQAGANQVLPGEPGMGGDQMLPPGEGEQFAPQQ